MFWFSMILIFYTYLGYPILLLFAGFLFRKPVKKSVSEPSVSIVISAFNEEKAIEKKLVNILNLDYPENKMEILVGSDGGSDQTDEIVSKFRSGRIRFFRFVQNSGKPQVLKSLIQEAKSEIIVFTDSRQELDRAAIRALVANFEDPKVGCVSGELYFKTDQVMASVGSGMDAYWKYEKFLRKKESEIGSMLGATGASYAVRKSLFPSDLPNDILVDDMYIPLSVIRKGFRAIFDSGAHAFDQPSEKGEQEMKRKVRTLTGNYQIFACFPDLFNPLKSPVAWQFFSHKFLRLMVPFMLLIILISNLFLLGRIVYILTFTVQIIFYGLAGLEAFNQKRGGKKTLGYIPYTFCLLNYSAFLGFIKFLSGDQKANWEKAYV